MKESKYLEEKNELVDIVHCAFNDWDNYNDDCYFEHISPIESVEDFVADAVLHAGYRKQEWISIEERLPERNGRYLTHCNVEGQSLVCILYYCKVGGFNEETVTHWMPLPQPPKGE